jgi:hypothetical protein
MEKLCLAPSEPFPAEVGCPAVTKIYVQHYRAVPGELAQTVSQGCVVRRVLAWPRLEGELLPTWQLR